VFVSVRDPKVIVRTDGHAGDGVVIAPGVRILKKGVRVRPVVRPERGGGGRIDQRPAVVGVRVRDPDVTVRAADDAVGALHETIICDRACGTDLAPAVSPAEPDGSRDRGDDGGLGIVAGNGEFHDRPARLADPADLPGPWLGEPDVAVRAGRHVRCSVVQRWGVKPIRAGDGVLGQHAVRADPPEFVGGRFHKPNAIVVGDGDAGGGGVGGGQNG
jgi:hypothetical protein